MGTEISDQVVQFQEGWDAWRMSVAMSTVFPDMKSATANIIMGSLTTDDKQGIFRDMKANALNVEQGNIEWVVTNISNVRAILDQVRQRSITALQE